MEKIGTRERIFYGFGDLASNLGNACMGWFAIYYYINVVHIDASAAGTMMLAVMAIDGIADVVMGVLVDRTHSRFGKARPWILRMFLPFSAVFALMYNVPAMAGTFKVVFAFFTLLFFNLLYSAVNIPYGILNSLITQDQYQRSVINTVRMFMAYGATILIGAATLKVVAAYGSGPTGWSRMAYTYAALAAVLFLATFLFTQERVAAGGKPVPLATAVKALGKNNCWWSLIAYAFFLYIFYAINSTATVYYMQSVLRDASLQSTVTFAFYIPIVVGMPVLARLIRRFGKRNLTVSGLCIAFGGTLVLLFFPTSIPAVIVSTVVKGIGMAPILGCFFALVSDTIEYGEWKTGVRSEGLIYSASSLGIKLGNGVGTAIVGWGLSIGGYAGKSSSQPASAVLAIRFLYTVLPLLLFVLMAFILSGYKLDKMYMHVESDLVKRSHAKNVPTPV